VLKREKNRDGLEKGEGGSKLGRNSVHSSWSQKGDVGGGDTTKQANWQKISGCLIHAVEGGREF